MHKGKLISFLSICTPQGSEYTSEIYQTYVEDQGVTISFSDKGSPWQNGFQESFYDKFKVDLGSVDQFEILGELIDAIYQQIYYYNNERIHTALKMSPVAFRKLYEEKSFQAFV